MSHVVMFHMFPLTRLMTDFVHEVLQMYQVCSCPFIIRLTLGFVYRMPKYFGKIELCMLSVKDSPSCACYSSYIIYIIILLAQLFCSICCKHDTCQKKNYVYVSVLIKQTTYLLVSIPLYLYKNTFWMGTTLSSWNSLCLMLLF